MTPSTAPTASTSPAPPPRRAWRWVLAIGSALFVLLSLDQVLHGPVYSLDAPLDAWLTRLAADGHPIHPWGNAFSQPGSTRVAAPLLLAATAVLLGWRRWALAAWCLGAGTLVGLLDVALKDLFRRPLPPFIFDRFPHSYAFPSGHTMGAAGTLGIAIWTLAEAHIAREGLGPRPARGLRSLALGLWVSVSLVTGVGRLLAQHHWLSDVLAAWALAPALVAATVLLAVPGQAASRKRARPVGDA